MHTVMALQLGANQCTDPTYSAKVCHMVVGNIITGVNKVRWTGPLFIQMFMALLHAVCVLPSSTNVASTLNKVVQIKILFEIELAFRKSQISIPYLEFVS